METTYFPPSEPPMEWYFEQSWCGLSPSLTVTDQQCDAVSYDARFDNGDQSEVTDLVNGCPVAEMVQETPHGHALGQAPQPGSVNCFSLGDETLLFMEDRREKRKLQNRIAQRAYRQRREKAIEDLQNTVKAIENELQMEKTRRADLTQRMGQLQQQLRNSKGQHWMSSASDSSFPALNNNASSARPTV